MCRTTATALCLKHLLGRLVCVLAASFAVGAAGPASGKEDFRVADYGAKADGTTSDTRALQAAIDECHASGGGRVVFPSGRFLSGTLRLKSNVSLHLEQGAVLLGSSRLDDFPEIVPDYPSYTYSQRALIHAEGAENIGITGPGLIDGQGDRYPPYNGQNRHGELEWGQSPYMVRFIKCRRVNLNGFALQNAPMVGLRLVACDDLVVDGVSIDNRTRISCDGVDLVGCSNVRVANCRIDTRDDALCLKSSSFDRCKNIVITNCVIGSITNAIKFGSESIGGFEDITVSNCIITKGGYAGLALELVDGGVLQRVSFVNIVMENVGAPIFVRLGNRGRTHQPGMTPLPPGRLSDVSFSNITATNVARPGVISGLPGHPIENLSFADLRLEFAGGYTAVFPRKAVPEYPQAYPESTMFGVLPAYGFYVRHVRNVDFRNTRLGLKQEDHRPAIFLEDVDNAYIAGFDAASSPATMALVQVRDSRGVFLAASRIATPARSLLLEENSSRVRLAANDTDLVQHPHVARPGITPRDGFAAPQPFNVTLTYPLPHDEIRYTTDGGIPDLTANRHSGQLRIEGNTHIRVRAFKDGAPVGFETDAIYDVFDEGRNGLNYRYYEGIWERLPDFPALKPVARGVVDRVTLDGFHRQEDYFGLVLTATLRIVRPGTYTFRVTSDDGSRLSIAGRELVAMESVQAPTERSATIPLNAGDHPLRLEYFDGQGGQTLQLLVESDALPLQPIPRSWLFK